MNSLNTDKTKVMVSEKNKCHLEKLEKLPCAICGNGTVNSSILRNVANGYTKGAHM